MDPVTIMAALATAATLGTQISKVKTALWDPIVWPLAKATLYVIVAAALVSVVQTNLRLRSQEQQVR